MKTRKEGINKEKNIIFSFPEIVIIFVVGIPIFGDEIEKVDLEFQEKLEFEFEMFGDTLQVTD